MWREPIRMRRMWTDICLQTDRELMTGDFVRVRITGSHEYDLMGELEDESAE